MKIRVIVVVRVGVYTCSGFPLTLSDKIRTRTHWAFSPVEAELPTPEHEAILPCTSPQLSASQAPVRLHQDALADNDYDDMQIAQPPCTRTAW